MQKGCSHDCCLSFLSPLFGMDQSLYRYSLYAALPLMLFFGFHMLLARAPEKKVFSRFLLSRRLMGAALLVLSANYSVHFLLALRLRAPGTTVLLNLATYFLCYFLFSAALLTLLRRDYVTLPRLVCHAILWLCYSALACAVALCSGGGAIQQWGTLALAACLVVYGVFLSVRLLRTYARVLKLFEDTRSDDVEAYVRWMSVFTYWAVGFGVSQGLLTFLPDRYVFLWILSSIPFYIYLYCCYQNYLLFHEQVAGALDADTPTPEEPASPPSAALEDGNAEAPAYHPDIRRRVEEWTAREGYCKPGLTLSALALQLCTNRTYLSEYINSVCGTSFRDWITALRIDYAKRLMRQQPRLKVQEVAERAGFLSLSHFIRTFREREGCSPARWRKDAGEA